MSIPENSHVEKLPWVYEPHLRQEQLGEQKYAKASTAISELICNSFDAGAQLVNVVLTHNQLGGLDSIRIEDDGRGITAADFKERFVRVGVRPNSSPARRFGKFGLGRFAVYRLGGRSEWESVSKNTTQDRAIRIRFALDRDSKEDVDLRSDDAGDAASGTRITIFNIPDATSIGLTEQRLKDEILASFISFLLSDGNKSITLNGQILDPKVLIEQDELEHDEITYEGRSVIFTLRHVTLCRNFSKERFPGQVLLCGDGKLCASEEPEVRVSTNYLAIVDSEYLSEICRTNRESVVQMDPIYGALLEQVRAKVSEFQQRDTLMAAKRFLEDARAQKYYPFQGTEPTPEAAAKQALYDVALEKINEHVDLGRLTKKQQAVVFQLLSRAMSNSNIMDVLTEVARLSDEDFDKFRKILERTTLEQVLRLSDEVTRRLQFLDSLHELIYGQISNHLEERTHLHKILEQHSWIFGEKYQLTTSDKSFRTLIGRHRSELGLPPAEEEDLKAIKDYRKIPDLYFTASRSFPIEPRHHNLIVEIKAPDVTIAGKEVEQIKKYAGIVRASPQLIKEASIWELYLVSSEIHEDVEAERSQNGRPHGLLQDHKGIKIWIFRWSEIIRRARDEMQLVSNHLRLKTEELAVSEDLKRQFPFLVPLTRASDTNSSSTGTSLLQAAEPIEEPR